MILILGGAYMGKFHYARSQYDISEAFDLETGFPDRECPCFRHLEALTWAEAQKGTTAQELFLRLEPYFKNALVISREVGSGVVPMDKTQRFWRELHGSLLQLLAKEADSVQRVFCGIPEVLK